MNAHSLAVDHSEISSLAAECGIDWSQITDLGPGMRRNLPVLSKKYKGKCAMWVDEKVSSAGGTFLRITFHTKKHGGVSRTWHSHARWMHPKLSLAACRPEADKSEEQQRRTIFGAYREAFKSAPRAAAFPYLQAKSISDIVKYFDLRILTDAKVLGKGAAKAFIGFPLYSPRGEYVGLQRIYADGTKKLTTAALSGQYRGAHAVIGDPEKSETIYITEGFATAASIHLATGDAAIFAYNAGNLDAVATHIASRYEGKKIIIAADNDITPSGNTGVYKAWEAAKASGITLVIPPSIEGEKTDFNDIHVALGLAGLLSALKNCDNHKRPSANRCAYILELLRYSRRQEMSELVTKLASAAQVPYKTQPEELMMAIERATEGRFDRQLVEKKIRALAHAAGQIAKELIGIKPTEVDHCEMVTTEQNEYGHYVIGKTVTEAVLRELDKGSIVILKAPMATGKTERVIKTAMARATRTALVLPRVSVCVDAGRRLNLPVYRNLDSIEAMYTEKMVTCVNSLGAARFASNGAIWFDKLDLLCLDEASQALPQIVQLGDADQRRKNHEALIRSIRTSKAVLVADADANEFLLGELRRIDPGRRIALIQVEHPAEAQKSWKVSLTESGAEVRDALVKAALGGEKCLLATDNRRKAMEIERLLLRKKPDLRILNIRREPTREEVPSIQAFYSEPNSACKHYDVLIYSPAITSGLSLTTPHFQRHFGIFTGVIKATDILQMLGRDRTASAWLLSLKSSSLHSKRLSAASDLSALGETPTLFSELKMATDRFDVAARENMLVLGINILKLKGHSVTLSPPLKKKVDKETRRLLREVSDEIKAERMERILSQPEISDDSYKDLKKLSMPTCDEAAAMIAYRVRNYLCAPLEIEQVEFMDNGGLKKIALFETALSDRRDLESFDHKQLSTHDPSLRYYAVLKSEMLNETFKLLGLNLETLKGEFTHRHCQDVVAYFLANAGKANFLFDGVIDPDRPPRCPTSFVLRLFALLGINVGKRKSVGRMIRFLDQSSIDVLISYMSARYQMGRCYIPQLPRNEAGSPP